MTQSDSPAPPLIGEHMLIQNICQLIREVAPTDATILVMGESGTGKELVARAVHTFSQRGARPFIPVNCGAIPAELLESEMFGDERSAVTGAIGQRAGMFQLANGGTIFLDEVGEMSATLQVKLLRVLQGREIRPVGTNRSMKIDVRVIAASNKDLTTEVDAGRFREDLFDCLQVIPIVMPPLRERRSDIPLLTRHFLERHNRKRTGRPVEISEEAMVRLRDYDWPGNVRELENMVERLVILCEGESIQVEHLPSSIRSFISEKTLRRSALEEALRRTNGDKQAAARLLGLKRTTLIAALRPRLR